jgi:hypothetical protein
MTIITHMPLKAELIANTILGQERAAEFYATARTAVECGQLHRASLWQKTAAEWSHRATTGLMQLINGEFRMGMASPYISKNGTLSERAVRVYRRAYFGRLRDEPPVTEEDMKEAELLQQEVGSKVLDKLHDFLKRAGNVATKGRD